MRVYDCVQMYVRGMLIVMLCSKLRAMRVSLMQKGSACYPHEHLQHWEIAKTTICKTRAKIGVRVPVQRCGCIHIYAITNTLHVTSLYIDVYTYMDIYIYVYIAIYMYTCICNMCVYIHIYTMHSTLHITSL